MDRTTLTGFLLIGALLLIWTQLTGPTQAEIVEQQRVQDSLAAAQAGPDLQGRVGPPEYQPDTSAVGRQAATAQFGDFTPRAGIAVRTYTLENEDLKLTFSNLGGRIVAAEIKGYEKLNINEEGEEVRARVLLLEDERNRWNFRLPANGVAGGIVQTADLPFEATVSGNAIAFRAPNGSGGYLEQRYTLPKSGYAVEYAVDAQGLAGVADALELEWVNYLDKIEKNVEYEQQNALTYWREVDENPDYVSASGEATELADGAVAWVSNTNQFFNTSLVAKERPFGRAEMRSETLPEDAPDLKRLETHLSVPLAAEVTMYVGPNEFEALRAVGEDLEDIIPFGWSLFGTVNRWIVRPIFSFLSSFIGQAGLVILTLTFIIKLALYPLTYKMLYSQAKMQALKPRLAKLRAKYKDDQQQQQMETMKVYREYGVNPAGGCLPMILQMPIWFALYRFFPASIEFRQEGFLWATDLSSYDEFFQLPFAIPFYGDHVSMFTLLWVITTIAYTYYNQQMMDMGQMANNPALKYMQYGMPVMFLFFFNNFAAGLTVYLVFSNLFNIAQTIVTKNVIIAHEKIERNLVAAKAKPKKKSGFGARLEEALKEQQRIAAQRQGGK